VKPHRGGREIAFAVALTALLLLLPGCLFSGSKFRAEYDPASGKWVYEAERDWLGGEFDGTASINKDGTAKIAFGSIEDVETAGRVREAESQAMAAMLGPVIQAAIAAALEAAKPTP
jgi:hypothetical protein